MKEFLIDEHGEVIEPDWLHDQAAHFKVPQSVFESYAVRHLGCIHLRRQGGTVYVAIRLDRLTRQSVDALKSQIAAGGFDMAVFSVFEQGDVRHELLPSPDQAQSYVGALSSRVPHSGKRNRIERFHTDYIAGDHPLADFVSNWKPRAGLREIGRLIERAAEASQGRYIIAERVESDAEFVLREFGRGYPQFAVDYLEIWLGKSPLAHPDKHYGAECVQSLAESVRTQHPVIEVVDATVYWPLAGHLHFYYSRALLPVTDPSGRTWIITSSIEGRGVVA